MADQITARTIRLRADVLADAWAAYRVCVAEARYWQAQGEAFAAIAQVAAAVVETAYIRALALAGLDAEEVAA